MSARDVRRKIRHSHDLGYKYLLSSKKIFLELLHSFVGLKWVDQIDDSNLIQLDKSYVLPDFSDKEADLVYQLKLKDQDVIFYVLMELQSTVDFQMPYRLLLYQVEIWRDMIGNVPKAHLRRKSFRLPAIVPIVLYSGSRPWTASCNFREYTANQGLFGEELLNFNYILLDVQRYTDEELLNMSNTIGSVFLLEKRADLELLNERLQKLMGSIQSMSPEMLQRFVTWLRHIMSSKIPKDSKTEIMQVLQGKGKAHMISNLEKTIGKILRTEKKKGRLEGREEGIQEGIQEGMQQGMQQGSIQTKVSIARNLVGMGLDSALISQATGLTPEEVEELKEAR